MCLNISSFGDYWKYSLLFHALCHFLIICFLMPALITERDLNSRGPKCWDNSAASWADLSVLCIDVFNNHWHAEYDGFGFGWCQVEVGE